MFSVNSINADTQYKGMLNHIITQGTDTSDGDVRPVWGDTNEPAYTIKAFSIRGTYDLRKEFPLLTCRRIATKVALDELYWIYQKKSNLISDINSHIWDSWAKPDPYYNNELSVGRTYGWQVGNKTRNIKTTWRRMLEINPKKYEMLANIEIKNHEISYASLYDENQYISINQLDQFIDLDADVILAVDQVDYIIHEVIYNQYSRRLEIVLLDIDDVPYMNLEPCCDNLRFNVTKNDLGEKVLNLELEQRSLDTVVAGGHDVFVHAMLLRMIAQVTGCIAGEFVHNICDAHIYNRHVDQAKALINANTTTSYYVWLNPNVKCFYDFTMDDVEVRNYEYDKECTEICKKLPVAI